MSLSFPGEFPGKDRTDFVVGPVASPDSVPRDTVETGSKMPSRFRVPLGRVGNYGSQIPTHHHEEQPTPSQRAAQRDHDHALLRKLEANRPPEERQATLDRLTSAKAQEEFAKLRPEVQVSLLRAIGVNIDRPMDEEYAQQMTEGAAALQAMIAAREQARTEDRQFEEDNSSLPRGKDLSI